MHISLKIRLLGAGVALSLPLLTVPLAASPALADVAPPSGCTEITDNSGVSGFGLHDNGHNVQATSTRAAQCWQFLNQTISGGHTWYQLKDTAAGLCLDDVKEAEFPESCPAGDTAEMWRIVGANNNMLQNEASGHYLNAASISNNAIVGSTPNSNPQATNTWEISLQPSPGQVDPVAFPPFPGYNSSDWTAIENSEPFGAVTKAVVEICDLSGNCGGNAQSKNTNWDATLDALSNAGVTPLYYISTNNGSVPLTSLETAVDNGLTWYNGDGKGIGFLFDVANPSGSASCQQTAALAIPCETYYQDLVNYVASTKGVKNTVMLNYGSPPDYNPATFGSSVIAQVFEGTQSDWTNRQPFPSWMSTCGCGSQLSVTLNDVSSTGWQSDVNAIHATDDIRNMYLTDGTGGNPYSGLATYFANETAYVASLSS
jgi:hypothetical protein